MFTFFDPNYWIIVGPTMLLAFIATLRVQSTFAAYQNVGVRSGMTGAEAAAAVARAGGAEGIQIERVQGFLSDHYDPRTKTLRLSPAVYDGRSISAIAVGAHEAGHAVQHAHAYKWLTLRSQMVPVASIGSNLWIWIFIAGMIMNQPFLVNAGIVLFAVVVVFQLITLPVEFNASSRAVQVLESTGMVTSSEVAGARAVLNAAALTYVAAFVAALGQLLYFFALSRQ